MNTEKNRIIGIARSLMLIITLLISIISCSSRRDSSQTIKDLLVDTLNLRLTNIEIKIDSINSGISRNLREILPLRDSIEVNFNEYFDKTPVILIHNKRNLYQDTLQTTGGMGWSSDVIFKRGETHNTFDLRIEGKRYIFKELNDYNFIHIFYHSQKGLEIVYTNKGYVYD
jgi:hypothetical protein